MEKAEFAYHHTSLGTNSKEYQNADKERSDKVPSILRTGTQDIENMRVCDTFSSQRDAFREVSHSLLTDSSCVCAGILGEDVEIISVIFIGNVSSFERNAIFYLICWYSVPGFP